MDKSYLDVRKTVRDKDGNVLLTFLDVVIRTSTAWDHLQTAETWTTKAVGYEQGATVTYERA